MIYLNKKKPYQKENTYPIIFLFEGSLIFFHFTAYTEKIVYLLNSPYIVFTSFWWIFLFHFYIFSCLLFISGCFFAFGYIPLKNKKRLEEKFVSGTYKTLPNRVGNISTVEVHEQMENLINDYTLKNIISIEDILLFHIKFERIHPFQDSNSSVGRIIMFREYLKNNIAPFIIKNGRNYYQALNDCGKSKSILGFT